VKKIAFLFIFLGWCEHGDSMNQGHKFNGVDSIFVSAKKIGGSTQINSCYPIIAKLKNNGGFLFLTPGERSKFSQIESMKSLRIKSSRIDGKILSQRTINSETPDDDINLFLLDAIRAKLAQTGQRIDNTNSDICIGKFEDPKIICEMFRMLGIRE
jgi:hypothetical protein